MMTITKNRALTFLAALEVLQKNTAQMVEVMRREVSDHLSEEDFDKHVGEFGTAEDALNAFDDAVQDMATERNRYVEELELDLHTLNLNWKERR